MNKASEPLPTIACIFTAPHMIQLPMKRLMAKGEEGNACSGLERITTKDLRNIPIILYTSLILIIMTGKGEENW